MNLKQELKNRKIKVREFCQAINWSEQRIYCLCGSKGKPKEAPAIVRLAFTAFLCERAGIDLSKLI